MSTQIATKRQHLAKAHNNRQLSTEIETKIGGYREWQIITVFYAAVHQVQAYLRAKTTDYPQTHGDRDKLIAKIPDLRPIYGPYKDLKHLSVQCRYTCQLVKQTHVDQARQQYETIQTHIETLLSASTGPGGTP